MAQHNQLGKEGEEWAMAFLVKKGFKILHRNWRFSHFEIDIIATIGEVLHFIEVKTRSGDDFGMPEESISKKKIRNLMNAGAEYLHHHPQWNEVQYDVLAINLFPDGTTEHFFIEDVYTW